MEQGARGLTFRDIKTVLARLQGAKIVLIGGQALNFWAEHFLPRAPELAAGAPYTSKDIDFCGDRAAVIDCASRLQGRFALPSDFESTVNSGVVLFVDGDGTPRQIDFLDAPYGLRAQDVFDTSIPIEELDEHGEPTGIRFSVMHPVRCMESRVHNVIGLRQTDAHALKQLRASIFCARELLRDLLEQGYVREVLKLSERIFELCRHDIHGRVVHARTSLDPFEAVLCIPPLPERFIAVRYPQMQACLRRLRERRLL
ncbi:MAG: hypothetical protein R3B70_19790 [Polyangiaceae bacterium]